MNETELESALDQAMDDHALEDEREYKKGFAAGARWLRIELEEYFLDNKGRDARNIIDHANLLIFGKE